MRKLLLATTALLVVNLATLPPAAADFGSWLETIPFWSDQAAASESDGSALKVKATRVAQPALPSETAVPRPLEPLAAPEAATTKATTKATEEASSDPETLRESLDQPPLNRIEPSERQLSPPAPAGTSRSPLPPPHAPDASYGMKSEWSVRRSSEPDEPDEPTDAMIEADAERAAPSLSLPRPPVSDRSVAVGSGAVGGTGASSGQACECRSARTHHAHALPCGSMPPPRRVAQARPAPTPYVYTGPGLPSPASLESYYRTPECYRGVWDGYAEEKARRCRLCHAHLHGYCDCHQGACGTTAPCSGEPCGHCAQVPSDAAPGY
jgi:hypothetical protein